MSLLASFYRRSALSVSSLCSPRFAGAAASTSVGFFSSAAKTSASVSAPSPGSAGISKNYAVISTGSYGFLDYRVHFHDSPSLQRFSAWHSFPLLYPFPLTASASSSSSSSTLFSYINEIPLNSRAKYEIATKEPLNPIKQDVKKGALRYFKYGAMPFNYGAISQTWEDPSHIDSYTSKGGDNDPIDVVELSDFPLFPGAILPVKIVGALALIDEGETDWKILALSAHSPYFDSIKTFSDAEKIFAKKFDIIKEWFINYKTADGKEKNVLAIDGNILDEAKARDIVFQTHEQWKTLIQRRPAPDAKDPLWTPGSAK